MNAVSRTIERHLAGIKLPAMPLADHVWLRNFILAGAIFASALAVIVVKDMNRQLFIRYQQLTQLHEKNYETWGALSLEQSTLSTPSRVQRIASQRLSMDKAIHKDITLLSTR